MRLDRMFGRMGLVAVALGLGGSLASIVGGCGNGREGGTEPVASQAGQAAAQVQLPSLDLDAPHSFQTASFALG